MGEAAHPGPGPPGRRQASKDTEKDREPSGRRVTFSDEAESENASGLGTAAENNEPVETLSERLGGESSEPLPFCVVVGEVDPEAGRKLRMGKGWKGECGEEGGGAGE